MSSVAGFQRIAVCLDGDQGADDALAAARRLRAPGGELLGVHVLAGADPAFLTSPTTALPPVQEAADHGRDLLRRMLDEPAGERPVLLAGADPARAVCAWAEDDGHPDLIVVAAVRGGLARALRGAFAAHVAYHAPCPVLVVRRDAVAAG